MDVVRILTDGNRDYDFRRFLKSVDTGFLEMGKLTGCLSDDPLCQIFLKQWYRNRIDSNRHTAFFLPCGICLCKTSLAGTGFLLLPDACDNDFTVLYPDDSYL